MIPRRKLPSIRTLRHLADMDGPFPVKSRHVVLAAERFCFDDNVINFLKLFPSNEVFRSRDEFVQRCKVLESLIRAEQEISVENIPILSDYTS